MTEARTHARREIDGGLLPLATGMLFFVPLVLVGNQVGAVLRYPELGAAVIFPPYGVLTTALVVSARRHWGWYILVAAIAHAIASLPHWTLSWVLFADAANIARALVAAVLLRRLLGHAPRLDGIRALVQFFVSAVLLAPAVGATIGAASVVWHGASPTYSRPWASWFLSNALTGLTMLPGLLVAASSPTAWRGARIDRSRLIEALLLAVALAIMCAGAFDVRAANPGELTWLLYAPLPILIWAAMRFGQGGASLALTAVAGAAIWGADRGTGPFVSRSPDDNVLSLQLFMLLTALPVLSIVAIGGARRGAIELYRALLASLQDHVAVLDAHGTVLEVNQSWQRFADAGHACPLDRVRTGDDYLAACREAFRPLPGPDAPDSETDDVAVGNAKAARVLAGVESVLAGACRRFEMEYEQIGEGTREWYILRIEALERADGGVVVTRASISARHRAEIEIEARRREVTHLARVSVLGQLSGALAHELRQPLSSILSNAEAAQRLLHRQPLDFDELSAALRDIATEDRRAAQIIDGLQSMLNRGTARVRPVDTEALVRTVLVLANAELISRRVAMTTAVDPGLPPLLADAVQVQQVLLNLILNACEAMSSTAVGDGALLLRVTMAGASDVRLSIRDQGAGIPLTLIERLFEPFVTTKPDGLGLGLSIARSIVDAHGGRIWAENNVDGGATISFELPSAPTGDAAPTARLLADVSGSRAVT